MQLPSLVQTGINSHFFEFDNFVGIHCKFHMCHYEKEVQSTHIDTYYFYFMSTVYQPFHDECLKNISSITFISSGSL